MKIFFTTAMLLVVMNTVILAQPTAITWQGKLLDDFGNAITQNNVAMTFAMFDAPTGGSQLWPASGVVTKTVDVDQGLYSVQLGTGVGDDVAFTTNMFNGKTPWLEVKVETETLPRTGITNAPFALISNELSASGWGSPGEIGRTTPNTGMFTSIKTEGLKVTTGASDGKVLTSDADGNASWTKPQYQASGTAPGQMQYWNGTDWVTVAAGKGGQTLIFTNNSPIWVYDYDIINHLNIGDYYKGGIIAYFLQPGDPGYDASVRHGLIAAPADQSMNTTWGCYGTTITGADGTSLGSGAQNTVDIIAECSTVYIAARICNDLELNGYDDWYLPGKDELNKLFLNKDIIGGFAAIFYWSSSEYSSYHAWLQYFNDGNQYDISKSFSARVRAVRAF